MPVMQHAVEVRAAVDHGLGASYRGKRTSSSSRRLAAAPRFKSLRIREFGIGRA